ncbi:uncharacterized protein DNG_02905 [Cephalotrichum gorgonifer]|uniref:V-snare n=1 Tax=Cephalotrichum gorgonifer TaxID=2041049 RepID=A0AAE8MV76_9PEZI|nr:uncharacterized protein DNG_02905 [Cephalotrichum gorgonifer]
MGSKRNLDDDVENLPAVPSSKRPKRDGGSSKRNHQNAYMDPTWGQKYFFLSQDATSTIPQEEGLEWEDDADAMAYLRGVRKQATSIPHLLVAPKIGPQLPSSFQRNDSRGDDDTSDEEGEVPQRTIYDNGTGDFRGYYRDGAYTAAPDPKDDTDGDEYHDSEEGAAAAVAEAYFTAIRTRFHSLRSRLHTSPPPHLVTALPASNSPLVGAFGPRSYTFIQWTKRLESTDPLPVQVASMDKDAVLRILRVMMGGKFLRVGREVSERTSRWLWALLARLPPVGELAHTEVGWVRDLGRRAVLLGRSLAEMAALREEMAGGGGDLGINDGVDESDEDEDVAQEFEGDGIYSEDDETRPEGTQQSDSAEGDGGETDQDGRVDVDGGADTKPEDGEGEEGVEEEAEGDAPMDMDIEGEDDADDEPPEDLEAAKRRLLAQIGQIRDSSPQESVAGEEDDGGEATMRARMNMRATINMILTVAGEFYGQRDLLEFRDPFTGI